MNDGNALICEINNYIGIKNFRNHLTRIYIKKKMLFVLKSKKKTISPMF